MFRAYTCVPAFWCETSATDAHERPSRNATLVKQMGMLTEAFVPTGFGFNLIEVVRTINASWSVWSVVYVTCSR